MKDNITDWALKEYQLFYKDDSITKENIFYYIYGILHHLKYREKYKRALVHGIPNIPMASDFWLFNKAGNGLGIMHLNYETCNRYDLGKPLEKIPDSPKKIIFGRKIITKGKTEQDRSILILDGIKIYNNLPIVKYHVNGNSPIGWFVNRYGFSQDKETEITNYPLENVNGDEVRAIIERLVYVGVESDRIMEEISKEPFESPDAPKYNNEGINKQSLFPERIKKN